jgi:hypothetical protein
LILPDSSAWIEELRSTGSPLHRAMRQLLEADAEIAVTEPVIMELLAGARSKRELAAPRRRLLAFTMLRVQDLVTYERASAVWRACRRAGEPVRNTLDCLIAAVAIREGASVLHADRDFDVIARHTELQVYPLGG